MKLARTGVGITEKRRVAGRAAVVLRLAIIVKSAKSGSGIVLKNSFAAEAAGNGAQRQAYAEASTTVVKHGYAGKRSAAEQHLRVGPAIAASALDVERRRSR